MAASELARALDAYRAAVAASAYWSEHGRRGDGNDTRAAADERAARAAVFAAARR